MIKERLGRQGSNMYAVRDLKEYIWKYLKIMHITTMCFTEIKIIRMRRSRLLLTFQSARTVLLEGGIFLFDVWYRPGV